VLALAGTQWLLEKIKAIERDDLIPLWGLVAGAERRDRH
jgi:hypothetical protein